MLKKISIIVLCGIVLLGVCGCGKEQEKNSPNDNIGQQESNTPDGNVEHQDNDSDKQGEMVKIKLQTTDIDKVKVGDYIDVYNSLNNLKVLSSVRVENIDSDYAEVYLYSKGLEVYQQKRHDGIEMVGVLKGSHFIIEQDNDSPNSNNNTNNEDKNSSNNNNGSKTIEITLDNWQQYFEVYEWVDWGENAFGEPTRFFGIRISFNIKDEYKNNSTANIAAEYLINQSHVNITYDVKSKTYTIGPPLDSFDEHLSTLSGGAHESYISFSLGDDGQSGSYTMTKYNFVKMTRIKGSITIY